MKPCRYCDGDHLSRLCAQRPKSRAPLETPSHNGPYQGDPAKVQVIKPGVCGSDILGWKREAGELGRRKRWRESKGTRALKRANALRVERAKAEKQTREGRIERPARKETHAPTTLATP